MFSKVVKATAMQQRRRSEWLVLRRSPEKLAGLFCLLVSTTATSLTKLACPPACLAVCCRHHTRNTAGPTLPGHTGREEQSQQAVQQPVCVHGRGIWIVATHSVCMMRDGLKGLYFPMCLTPCACSQIELESICISCMLNSLTVQCIHMPLAFTHFLNSLLGICLDSCAIDVSLGAFHL